MKWRWSSLAGLSAAAAVAHLGVAAWVLRCALKSLQSRLSTIEVYRTFVEQLHCAIHGIQGGEGDMLGDPDAFGVYRRWGPDGEAVLWLRRTPAGSSHGWEFSLDGMRWQSSLWAEFLLRSRDGSPLLGERLLLLRLELEARLAGGGAGAPSGAAPRPGGLTPTRMPQPSARQQLGGWQQPGAAEPLGSAAAPAGPDQSCGLPPLEDGGSSQHQVAEALAGRMPPAPFLCPLGMEPMMDPVVTPSGMSYERASLAAWVARCGTDPATGKPLAMSAAVPNVALRDLIQAWLVDRPGSAPGDPASPWGSRCGSPLGGHDGPAAAPDQHATLPTGASKLPAGRGQQGAVAAAAAGVAHGVEELDDVCAAAVA